MWKEERTSVCQCSAMWLLPIAHLTIAPLLAEQTSLLSERWRNIGVTRVFTQPFYKCMLNEEFSFVQILYGQLLLSDYQHYRILRMKPIASFFWGCKAQLYEICVIKAIWAYQRKRGLFKQQVQYVVSIGGTEKGHSRTGQGFGVDTTSSKAIKKTLPQKWIDIYQTDKKGKAFQKQKRGWHQVQWCLPKILDTQRLRGRMMSLMLAWEIQ